jgi:hypothetical protein
MNYDFFWIILNSASRALINKLKEIKFVILKKTHFILLTLFFNDLRKG